MAAFVRLLCPLRGKIDRWFHDFIIYWPVGIIEIYSIDKSALISGG